jgi:methylmalonyl-CoA/ethylmalonyl-CoA epimerase
MNNPVPLNTFVQIALVVSDIELALDEWCKLCNAPRPQVHVKKAEPNPNEKYRGQTACYGLKVASIDCKERGFIIEVHEPDENPSTFREFLDKHGNGVHHIGFNLAGQRDAVVGELETMGYVLRNIGIYPGGSWTIMDTEDKLGVNINVNRHPDKK